VSQEPWVIGVGSPGILLLNSWGDAVRRVFDATPYLVGSASMSKQWRDVDVRLILEGSEWEHWFGRFERPFHTNARWAGICLAFSLWGQKVTGLPIDFQVQQASDAEAKDEGGNRFPLGVYPYPQPWQVRP
jgi:hypothetical protein